MSLSHLTGTLAVLAASASLLGCVATEIRPIAGTSRASLPSVPPSSVRLLPAIPNSAFTALGSIEVRITGFVGDEAILRKIREKAATLGANAVVVTTQGRTDWGSWPGDFRKAPDRTFYALATALHVAAASHPSRPPDSAA